MLINRSHYDLQEPEHLFFDNFSPNPPNSPNFSIFIDIQVTNFEVYMLEKLKASEIPTRECSELSRGIIQEKMLAQ